MTEDGRSWDSFAVPDGEQLSDGTLPGDSIPDVFPPDDVTARFVVAMSIARNDIELALRDGIRVDVVRPVGIRHANQLSPDVRIHVSWRVTSPSLTASLSQISVRVLRGALSEPLQSNSRRRAAGKMCCGVRARAFTD
jgi:hypothetical protein